MANSNPSQPTGNLPTDFPTNPAKTISQLDNKNRDPGPNRFNSWFYCHEAFKKVHSALCASTSRQLNPEDENYLSLNLAFYLASWGMYRGSSFLLQLDYKTHLPVVGILFEGQYDDLWDFDPATCKDFNVTKNLLFKVPSADDKAKAENNDSEVRRRIAGSKDWGLYWRLKYSYSSYRGEAKEGSDTLVTKILLGTLCCLPAYDRFFKAGVKIYKNGAKTPQLSKISANIECEKGFDSLREIVGYFDKIAQNVWRDFPKSDHHLKQSNNSYSYPTMKLVDMFFWNLGLGWGFVNVLCDKTDTLKPKKGGFSNAAKIKAIESAIEAGFIASKCKVPQANALSDQTLSRFARKIAKALI